MTREDKDKCSGVQSVSEPSAVYGMATEMRVFSEEELSHTVRAATVSAYRTAI